MSETTTFQVPDDWRKVWPAGRLANCHVTMTENAGDLVELRVTTPGVDALEDRAGEVEAAELAAARERYVYVPAAYQLGREAGEAAASWVVDGNTDVQIARGLLKMLDDGDPAAEQYLPRRPDLSGEFAEDLTPRGLYLEVTGNDPYSEADADTIQALSDAWEDGVADTFELTCEAELIKHCE